MLLDSSLQDMRLHIILQQYLSKMLDHIDSIY